MAERAHPLNDDPKRHEPVALFCAVHRGAEGAGVPLVWEWVSGDGDLDAARDTIAADGDRFMYVIEDKRGITEAWGCIDGEAVMLPRINWDGIAADMAGWGLHRDAVSAWQDCPAAPWLLYAAPQVAQPSMAVRALCAVIRAGLSGEQGPTPGDQWALDGVATLEAWSRGEVKLKEVRALERARGPVYSMELVVQDAARVALLAMRGDVPAAGVAAANSVRELISYKRMSQSRTLCYVAREVITPDMVFDTLAGRLRFDATMARYSAPDGALEDMMEVLVEKLAQNAREELARRGKPR